MDPQIIVSTKDKLLNLLAQQEDYVLQLEALDTNHANTLKELEDSRNLALESLEGSTQDYIASERVRLEKIYATKLKELEDARDKSLAEIETKLKTSRTEFLEKNNQPLLPIRNFSKIDAELKPIISNISTSSIYETVEKPIFKDINDVYAFNNILSKLEQLESVKDISLGKLEDKATLLLKPVEFLVEKFGEGKRAIIEIAYLLVSLSFIASYRHVVVPLLTLPSVVILCNRYRNTVMLNKYCSAYFQAHNYAKEIEDNIQQIMLQNIEMEHQTYRSTVTEKITRTYESEYAKLKVPDTSNIYVDKDTDSIHKQYQEAVASAERQKQDTSAELTYVLGNLKTEVNRYLTEVDKLSAECASILNTTEDNGTLPAYIHYGEVVNTHYGITYPYLYPTIKESCCITYDEGSKQDAVDFLKYYLLQLWRYVLPGYVKLEIIDTVDFGKDFADITVSEDKLIEIHTDNTEVTNLLNAVTEELKRRNTTILRKHPSIEEYNRVMHEQDASLCPYIVYVNVNPQLDHLMSAGHQALIQQASSCGILMINLMSKDIFATLKEEDYEKALTMYNHHEYKVLFENNTIKEGLQLEQNETFTPVKLNKSKYVEVADKMANTLKTSGIKPLWYHDHRERNFPDNWTKVPIEDIELQPGNINGEKDKPVTILLGDTNPHGLVAGRTGGGKSVLLNALLMSACHSYSPDWVQIVGVDFKGVELLVYGKPVSMPHFRAVSASRDVDYVLSIFEDLVGEMEARNKLFDKVLGFKNYVEFATAMLTEEGRTRIWTILNDKHNKELQTLLETKEGRNLYKSMTRNGKYPVLPRIVFVIDEFADMFLISDDLKVEVTKAIKTLAKKARSAGIHMLFASQNMEGTVPEETLEQFKLRICVPCSSNVSKTLLGNPEASRIMRGFAIVNDNIEEKENANIFFKVAFEKTPDIKDMIADLNIEATTLGYPKKIPIYDEAETYAYTDFRTRLHNNPKLYDSPVYILGEPRIYQRMDIPVTMSLSLKERQNVCIISKDKDALDSMSVVYMDNYARKDQMVYFHTADDEFLPKYDLTGQFSDVKRCEFDTRVDNLYTWLNNMVSHRTQVRKNGDNLKPIQVILHSINSMMSFGVDATRDDVQELLVDKILELNKLQVYFVLCSTSAKSMRRLFPFFTHILLADVDERDSGYLPEIASKALRNSGENRMFYINTDTSVIKSYKPYMVYKTEKIDDSIYFSA